MAPAFSKEAILKGSIDHLCLVCESYLRTEREICLHVSTAAHSQNLNSTDYVEKYRYDRIRKVKKWYFCEFCDVLVSTITAVGLHVEEPRHVENRSLQIIARVGDVITCGNVAIAEEAWHGFIDENTCIVCNIQYEDKDAHKREPTHVIKLVHSKVTDVNDSAYRKIDNDIYHCLICNKIVPEITTHFESSKHKDLLQDCIKSTPLEMENDLIKGSNETCYDKLRLDETCLEDTPQCEAKIEQSIGEDAKLWHITYDPSGKISCNLCNCHIKPLEVQIHLESSQHHNMLKIYKKVDPKPTAKDTHILDSMAKYQKDDININCESCTAVCTRCSVNLEFNSKLIENHIEGHKKNVQEEKIGSSSDLELGECSTTRASKTLFTSAVLQDHEGENKKNVETSQIATAEEAASRNDVQKMAEDHGLTYNSSNNKVYCQICNKRIPSSIQNINDHINGKLHKNIARSSNKPKILKQNETIMKTNVNFCNLQRVPTNQYIREVGTCNSSCHKDVILNQKYCINYYCFTFLTEIKEGHVRCQVCEVTIRTRDIKEHVKLSKHVRALMEVPVIIWNESEFIREIRSEIFQCGFCNIIDSWKGMENHMKSTVHQRRKKISNNRLTRLLLSVEDDVEHNMINSLVFMYFLDETFN